MLKKLQNTYMIKPWIWILKTHKPTSCCSHTVQMQYEYKNMFRKEICQPLDGGFLWGKREGNGTGQRNRRDHNFLSDVLFFFFIYFFGLFAFSRAAPVAYGGSQARGWIGARATATRDPSRVCDLHPGSWQRWISYPTEQGQGLNAHSHGY